MSAYTYNTQRVHMAKTPRKREEVSMVNKPILYGVAHFLEVTGLGRSTAYQLFARGDVKTVRVGRRRFVTEAALQEWIQALERDAENDRS